LLRFHFVMLCEGLKREKRHSGTCKTDVCDHIDKNHPDLWFIHNESSFHGWYTRGKQSGDLGNRTFVDKHVKN